jgi:hypothetical protein
MKLLMLQFCALCDLILKVLKVELRKFIHFSRFYAGRQFYRFEEGGIEKIHDLGH